MLIYIDGAAGATGLALEERLTGMAGLTLIQPEANLRKDEATRKAYLNQADVVFLCLPDDAAREAVAWVENPHTVVIDASTAHRTSPGWAYGFPELSEAHRYAVETSCRIAVPGCHASGFTALVYPLVQAGMIDREQVLYCHSLTGYSGGGKTMIADYESENATPSAAKLYALGLHHKHLPEMTQVCGLCYPPIFVPTVANVRQGMVVCVPLAQNARAVWEQLSQYYEHAEQVRVMPFNENDILEMENQNGTDQMEIHVFGHTTQALLAARFDNLGKGSSGAALQCLKVRMGLCKS